MNHDVFDSFDHGQLLNPANEREFSRLPWNDHPSFPGVTLKHLVTSEETNGLFSYHLVKIEPGHAIGNHIHDPQLETHEVIHGTGVCRKNEITGTYKPGVISIFPPRTPHAVEADEDGLLIFAKFMPPLC